MRYALAALGYAQQPMAAVSHMMIPAAKRADRLCFGHRAGEVCLGGTGGKGQTCEQALPELQHFL